ncbi:hypothetical protein ABTF76_20915, partial [Acinetobacter baumannii]
GSVRLLTDPDALDLGEPGSAITLAGDDVLEATIGSPKMPAFASGLWTSTLLFLVASMTLLGLWAGRALSSPLSAFARAAENFSLNRSSA